ncbi:hypothetical protein N657DRAFT_298564 [Parathielavia appendiculata]|uniref:Uncharacterized protein n=1 Tax=Parathielavia appendiculata TaxID=2587402 RepID=A0AAN6U4A4_9PEZI|nr:hypothetical protein N657DRAFT_298564 [Parathielavia appendiculata]
MADNSRNGVLRVLGEVLPVSAKWSRLHLGRLWLLIGWSGWSGQRLFKFCTMIYLAWSGKGDMSRYPALLLRRISAFRFWAGGEKGIYLWEGNRTEPEGQGFRLEMSKQDRDGPSLRHPRPSKSTTYDHGSALLGDVVALRSQPKQPENIRLHQYYGYRRRGEACNKGRQSWRGSTTCGWIAWMSEGCISGFLLC